MNTIFHFRVTLTRMGTMSFGCSDFWDLLGRQALVDMLGRWYTIQGNHPPTYSLPRDLLRGSSRVPSGRIA